MNKTVNNGLRKDTGGERRLIPEPGFKRGFDIPGEINSVFSALFLTVFVSSRLLGFPLPYRIIVGLGEFLSERGE